MKPLKLKIKGVNSFNSLVEIDFEKLTERGIFGIFGPTGSGKSTIIDGINLALYGKIPRGAKNFINTNSDTAYVYFEFSVQGKEKNYYIVEREFKREKDTGNARTGKIRLQKKIGETVEIIEDKKKQVDDRIIEIIGLTEDDFTRTVVLPQGKFSEFLKLTGKDKSVMLERLFDLQKYGDDLINKFKIKIDESKDRIKTLEGVLSGYDDIKDIDTEEIEKEIKFLQNYLNTELQNKKIKDGEYEIAKIQWEKQQDLTKKQEELSKLKNKENQIIKLKIDLEKARKNEKHIIYVKNIEQCESEINKLIKNIKENEATILNIKNNKEKYLLDEKELLTTKNKIETSLENIEKNIELTVIGETELKYLKTLERIETGKELINNNQNEKISVEKELSFLKENKITKLLEIEQKLLEEKEQLDKEKQNLEEEITAAKNKNIANHIISTLKSGDICPVCNNVFHHNSKTENIEIKSL